MANMAAGFFDVAGFDIGRWRMALGCTAQAASRMSGADAMLPANPWAVQPRAGRITDQLVQSRQTAGRRGGALPSFWASSPMPRCWTEPLALAPQRSRRKRGGAGLGGHGSSCVITATKVPGRPPDRGFGQALWPSSAFSGGPMLCRMREMGKDWAHALGVGGKVVAMARMRGGKTRLNPVSGQSGHPRYLAARKPPDRNTHLRRAPSVGRCGGDMPSVNPVRVA